MEFYNTDLSTYCITCDGCSCEEQLPDWFPTPFWGDEESED